MDLLVFVWIVLSAAAVVAAALFVIIVPWVITQRIVRSAAKNIWTTKSR